MKIFNRKLLTSEEQSLSNKARANKIERDRIRNQKREAKVERTRAQTRIREQNGGTILQVKLAKIIGGKSKSERKFKRVDRRLAKAQSKRARKQKSIMIQKATNKKQVTTPADVVKDLKTKEGRK